MKATIGLTYRTGLMAALALVLAGCTGDGPDPDGSGDNTLVPGTTSFESEELGVHFSDQDDSGASVAPTSAEADRAGNKAPSGRMGEVEEADIYRMVGNRLYYFNTYRGFVVYDVTNPKAPARLSRLPVFGYPVEMFVDGNTVYALLRDALYLTQEQGRLRFARHNTSQLVAIDVTDIRNPRVLQTIDIKGELREGVSRKIENTVYVVSYHSPYYWYGWHHGNQTQANKEQAWVYSFDVSDPKQVRQVQSLKVFEGGSVNFNDPNLGISLHRNFSSVAIAATSNALMVVENWNIENYQSQPSVKGEFYRCGSYRSDQQSVVSIIDVSDPAGAIRLHSRFETAGHIGDQFKMTYEYDETAKTGTFFGIFARNAWSDNGCNGSRIVENVMESWDVTNGATPARLASLVFGKKDETVQGSAYDMDRKIAYAITARQIDPLYAIDLSDRTNPRVLSEIDGLSGAMNVFRLIADRNFLIGIGSDVSDTCQGFQDTNDWRPTQMAVSIIDVRNPSAARLVQRACVAIENAEWVGSGVNWNMDQAHKMIGMHSDGQVNVVTVPVYYYKRAEENQWWWYRSETAVGMMTWDLSQYDDSKSPSEQTVLQNFGTVVHPNGEVRRSIVFTHQTSGRRMMMNLSDTHISMVDVQDLNKPVVESVIEVAPYHSEIFGFSGYIVEHIQQSPYHGWGESTGASEFRVKLAAGQLEDAAPVASFRIGQVTRVLKHGHKLLLFRSIPSYGDNQAGIYTPPTSEVVVMDLSDPTHPRLAGSTPLPYSIYPYYTYYCGNSGYWGGYWFDSQNNWVNVEGGVVILTGSWNSVTEQNEARLVFLDLRVPGKPAVSDTVIPGDLYQRGMTLVADPVAQAGFFLTYRNVVGTAVKNGRTFTRTRYYAQRWDLKADTWTAGVEVNLPGRLVRTWAAPDGTRLYLSQDLVNRWVSESKNGGGASWQTDYRLNLLRGKTLNNQAVAELRDSHHFVDLWLQDVVPDGDRLYVNAARNYYWWYVDFDGVASGQDAAYFSDRLMVFDLSTSKLAKTYDQPTSTVGMRLMGMNQGHLFVNLPGDGVLAVDVSNPAQPVGRQFLRTLGFASHIEFSGNTAFIAAGYFGVYQMTLAGPSALAVH